MLFKVTYNYMQCSPEGGSGVVMNENVLYSCSEDDLVQYVNEFLRDNKSGYRTNISLADVKRV